MRATPTSSSGPARSNKDASLPDPDDCSAFDRIFVVSRADVEAYEQPDATTPDLADWPVALGAPVLDGDGVVGNYDLAGGDRPLVYGSQTAFWVMNDVGNTHDESETLPIGLEVRVSAFSTVADSPTLYQGTFYRYELVNRNSAPFTDAYLGLFVDPDLGDAGDDYIGSDSTRSLAFVYNALEEDAVYGDAPPAVGYDFLTGAASHTYFIGAGPPGTGDPERRRNTTTSSGGCGRTARLSPPTASATRRPARSRRWAFPGDPESEEFWSEVNNDGEGGHNPPGDRRQILSTGAFTIPPGGSHTVDFAILFAAGANHLNSVTALKAASDEVQARYDAGALFVPFPTPLPPEPIAAPAPVGPPDGAHFEDEPVTLAWTSAGEGSVYELSYARNPDFSNPTRTLTPRTSRTLPFGIQDTTITYYWHVRVRNGRVTSPYSETRSFSIFLTLQPPPPGSFSQGASIVEVAYPDAEICPPGSEEEDLGCRFFGGNTVWLDPNATSDYVVTTPDNDLSEIARYYEAVGEDDFEMRFTEACATPGACLAIYSDAAPGGNEDEIASVPFELWNVGTDAPGDETPHDPDPPPA